MRVMTGIQVCVGGSIIFQTKRAVLDSVPYSLLGAHHSFESGIRPLLCQKRTEEAIKQIIIENSDGLQFFPLQFDYLRRKFDHDHNNANNNDNDNDNDNDEDDENENENDRQNAPSKAVMPYTRSLPTGL